MAALLVVNGVEFPCPMYGLDIVSSQTVDAGRNAKNEVIGQLIGRKLWKINNLQWNGLEPETWRKMKNALDPFFVPVTFTGDDNIRRTLYMYPGDMSGKPLFVSGLTYEKFETCKFNLIDCGWN